MNALHRTLVGLTLAAGLLTACGGEDAGSAIGGGSSAQAFDLSDIGMRGRTWDGEAELLAGSLDFEGVGVEMSTITFSLNTGHRDMSDLNDPPLTFRDEAVDMALRISGLIEDHEPGTVTVAITSVSPQFTGGVGTAASEALMEDLAANGVEFPEVSSNSPILVDLQISAADENNERVEIRSDHSLIGQISLQDGRRSSL